MPSFSHSDSYEGIGLLQHLVFPFSSPPIDSTGKQATRLDLGRLNLAKIIILDDHPIILVKYLTQS